MKRLPFELGLAVAAIALSAYVASADTGIMTQKTAHGTILTDSKGMTLYTFDKDKTGASTCYGQCASNWPPVVAPAGAKADEDFGLTKRSDGKMQWTYYGKPLYRWINDRAPGDMTGDGIGGVWHVAKTE